MDPQQFEVAVDVAMSAHDNVYDEDGGDDVFPEDRIRAALEMALPFLVPQPTIGTRAELDALPNYAVIKTPARFGDGQVWAKRRVGDYPWELISGGVECRSSEAIDLPVTVLYATQEARK